MTSMLIAGATGLVGHEALRLAVDDPRVTRVVAPTRRPLRAHAKLENPVIDFGHLPVDADWWAVDGVVCALGTTIKTAGSKDAFRKIDFGYPLAVATQARKAGAKTFALTSAMGARKKSPIFYSRTKGELEDAIGALAYPSLTILRPGFLGGDRAEHRPGEKAALAVFGAVEFVLPKRYRIVPATRVAATLVRAAITGEPGRHVLESNEI